MKLQEISFSHRVKVLQVFRDVHEYGKDEKSFAQRKDEMVWQDIASKSGYVREGELYLPEATIKDPGFRNCGLITLEDNNHPMHDNGLGFWFRSWPRKGEEVLITSLNHCFPMARKYIMHLFELRSNEELELFLKWGYFEVGIPERKNHKLCELRQNQPVEVKINGKTESSLTSRRARKFKEQQYVFVYLGEFTKCKLLREPFELLVKRVPENRKVVDMLKRLW